MTVCFPNIHPYYDGTGRLSRTLMAARFARNGLFPVICSPELKRECYMDMIRAAQYRQPEKLCEEVIYAEITKLEFLLK
jgi:Fic family protein